MKEQEQNPEKVPAFNNIENDKYTVTSKNGETKEIYHNRAVTVNIVQFFIKVNEETDETTAYVLVTERGPGAKDFNGKLNLPCGHLDWNETIEDCATRELYEETGFLNYNLSVVGLNSSVTNNRQNVEVTVSSMLRFNSEDELPDFSKFNTDESCNVRLMLYNDLVDQVNENKGQTNSDVWAFGHDILTCHIMEQNYIKKD